MANPTPPTQTGTFGAPTSTLSTIEQKVRRLTRSPSLNQLSSADLDQYINTFVVYDFPEILRTFNLKTEFTFFTNPGQDVYPTDTLSYNGITTNPLYNFQNLYLSVHPPFYIAGYPAWFTQNREEFFGVYPIVNNITTISQTGNGATLTFTGVINSQQSVVPPGLTQNITLLQNNVLFSSVDSNGNGLALADVPVLNGTTGNPSIIGNLYDPNSAAYATALELPPLVAIPNNTINYLTGAFIATFTAAPAAGVIINSQTVPQIEALPQSILYHNNEFTIRPVPDQPYRVNFEVFQRPTALILSGQSPELEEYWQYIAYGAAKKIFEDRMDLDSVQQILPEFNRQERMVLRRTIVQNTNERTATIYTEQTGTSNGWGGNGWGAGGGPF